MIEFKTLKFKNFRSFGNNFTEFKFENGFDLLTGKNGHGKTSALQALTYGLYGKIPKIKMHELLNSTNNTELVVEITFIKKKDFYKIVRGERPKIFEIYKNGELIDQRSRILDQQEMLEKEILGINLTSFQMLVSLDTTLLNKSFISMSEHERRQFLETILDIRILYFINMLITQRLSLIKTNKLELEFKLKTRKEILESESKKYDDIVRINKEIAEHGNAMVLEREDRVQTLEDKLQKYDIAFQKIQAKKDEQTQLEIHKSRVQDHITKEKSTKKSIDTKILKLEAAKSAAIKCSKCGTVNASEDISDEYFESLLSAKEVSFSTLSSLQEEINNYDSELQKLLRVINDESRLRINKNSTELELVQALKELDKAKNFKLLPENKDEIIRLNTEIEVYTDEYSNLLNTEDRFNKIKRLVSDDGIKKKIFERYIPVFNKFLNELLLEFNLSYVIIFNDKFEISILDRGEERGYQTFSASEKMRINLVIMFSFLKLIENRNSFSMNILLIDELLDNALSSEVQELVLKFLKYKVENKNKIIVSHNNSINIELFDRIFNVQKIQGFSTLEQKE